MVCLGINPKEHSDVADKLFPAASKISMEG